MKTRHNNDTDWFRLVEAAVDGELDEPELSALKAEMAKREELQRLDDALREMRELVRLEVETAADSADLDGLWPRIEERLALEPAPRVDALTLQAFADGELPPQEAAAVAAWVSESDADRGRLQAIAEMGDLLRHSLEAAADEADLGQLWARLDAEIGAEIETRGGFRTPQPAVEPARAGWLHRFFEAIGGYRSLAMSAATAVAAVLIMLVIMPGGGSDGEFADDRTQALEIRVVHIDEVRSSPGYNVTVDSPTGTAPVIFIRPADSATGEPLSAPRDQGNGLFDNPI